MNVRDVLPRDAIQSIDEPRFDEGYFGEPDDEVVVVELDGVARAYPLRVLSYHEVVNDAVGGRPVAVTWCPICWSAVVYGRRVDGRTLTFGVSGKLADDALVLYDRETGSEWKQTTGECIAGPLSGATLEALPAPVTTWAEFREAYPDGAVLQPVRGDTPGAARAEYDMAPYERYARSDEFGLYGMRGTGDRRTWDREDVDAKTVVLGVEHGDEAVGYPRPRVEAAGGVVQDEVGGLDVVVFAAGGGHGLHAFEDPGVTFEPESDGRFRGDGTTWDGATGDAEDGRSLSRLPARRLFAFAWQDDHGSDAFWSGPGAED